MPERTSLPAHSNALAPLGVWLGLLRENRGVSPAYWGRLAGILLTSGLAAPLRLADRVLYGGAVAGTRIEKAPLFVLGVARSGTTHLQNLLSRDPQHGFLSMYHAAAPTISLAGGRWLKDFLGGFAPDKRPMDDMQVSMDLPGEEDSAVANTCRFSTIYAITFPQRAEEYFEKYCFMRGISDRDLRRWERVYLRILQKTTLVSDGRRLVLKSPVNTGRIPHMLRLFPDALFVHVVRDPYLTYLSLRHLFRTMVPPHQLQPVGEEALDDLAAYVNRETMRQYLKDRALIPESQLAEVRFEDLDRDPLGTLESVYEKLGLPGWEEARPHIAEYLAGLSTYRKNRYEYDEAAVALVRRECQFALDAWGYELPDS